MFGYIKPHSPELRVREDAYYRGIYCGLCRTMGRCTGCLSRLTLSYDFTCLALIRLAAAGEPVAFRPRRCAAHPLTRRAVAEPNEALRYCARTAALLGYHKLRDDIDDERGWHRTRARLALPMLAAMRRRAIRGDGSIDALDGEIGEALDALHALEAAGTPSVDQPADAFGALMRALAAHGLEGSAARVAGQLGHHFGRWLYVLDALDDYADDCRLGRYNPFAAARGGVPIDEAARQTYADALTAELMAAEAALDLLDLDRNPDNAGVLRNLLYLGMPRAAQKVLFPEAEEKPPRA
ncbi:MAG: hypothetical protein IKD37_03330 [Clostridia bacterium]|nr:hypothetical protein [Clostridia bacterium]